MQALRTAATGMAAQQLNVEVISNNIANMNTVAFKRQRAEFQDLLYQTLEAAGVQSSNQGTVVPTGVQIGGGVKAGSVYRIDTQGTLTRTDNTYDLAINGRGFFKVQLPNGTEAFTRAGNFAVSQEGNLVTQDGYQLVPNITIDPTAVEVTISRTGEVQQLLAGETAPAVAGQIQLNTFTNDAGLSAQGANLFLATEASGQPQEDAPGAAGFGEILQNYTEASNVDAVSEITALIVAQRAYEMNSKVISTADNMLSVANQIKA